MTSDTDLSHQTHSFKPIKLPTLITAVLLIAIVAGTAGYLLGSRNSQPIPVQQSSPSPQPTMTSQNAQVITFQPSLTPLTSPTLGPLGTPGEPSGLVHWITYTDATLGATFEYPSNWDRIYAGSTKSITGKGTDYTLVFREPGWTGNEGIHIIAVNYPENISLADFYRRYSRDGSERFKNVAFKETVNSHGIKFGSIVQPYTSPGLLETVHNGREYEISSGISVPPAAFQLRVLAEFNHLVDSFTFID
jgi:hypothetical protein